MRHKQSWALPISTSDTGIKNRLSTMTLHKFSHYLLYNAIGYYIVQ